MIKKPYKLKIISIILAGVFLFTSSTYAIDLSKRSYLRVPFSSGSKEFQKRHIKGLKKVAKTNRYSKEITSIADQVMSPFVIDGESISDRQWNLLFKFSELKHGVSDSIEYFAKQIAKVISEKLNDNLTKNKDDWVIIFAPGYTRLKIAKPSYLLALAVSEELDGIPLVELEKDRLFTRYAALNSQQLREEVIYGFFYSPNPEELKGKKVLIVDDCFVTGTVMRELARVLCKNGVTEIYPSVALKFHNISPNFEDYVNRLFILDKTRSKYDFSRLNSLLSESHVLTDRILKSLLTLFEESREDFDQFIALLDANLVKKIIEESIKYFNEGEEKDAFIKGISESSDISVEINSENSLFINMNSRVDL